jgi:hypothetical protein
LCPLSFGSDRAKSLIRRDYRRKDNVIWALEA